MFCPGKVQIALLIAVAGIRGAGVEVGSALLCAVTGVGRGEYP